MADNVVANAGAGGAIFATDEVTGGPTSAGAVHYPINKLAHGVLDSATLVSTSSGLPVQQQGTWTVSVSGTVTVDTEFPAAAALGDTDANPTTTQVGACLQVFNLSSSQWQRVTTSASDGTGSGNKIPAVHYVFNGATFDRLRTVGIGSGAAGTGILAVGTMMFNGATWDRPVGDTANGLDVDVTRLPALPAGGNAIGTVGVTSLPATTVAGVTAKTSDYNTGAGTDTVPMFGIALPASGGAVQGGTSTNPVRTDPTGTTTQPVSGTVSITANSSVNLNQVAGTACAVNSGNKNNGTQRVVIATDQPSLSNPIPVSDNSGSLTVDGGVTPIAAASGGATPGKIVSAASNNATNIKASAGTLYTLAAMNINAAVRYVKLYDKATSPTVGTDTPVQTFAIPGATTGGGFTLSFPVGINFANGIGLAIVTGIADSDNTAVAANEIVVSYSFK